MQNCPEKDCHQRVEDVHHEVFDKPDGLKERISRLSQKKMPWSALIWVVPLFFLITGGGFKLLYAKSEKNEEDIKILALADTELKAMYKESQQDKKETLEILREIKRDSDAKKIASKEIKEYNTTQNN